MPPAFQLYGSSPDVLAQQQRQYENFFVGAAESNRNAAASAAQINLNAYMQARRDDEAARVGDRNLRINLMEYGNTQAANADRSREDRRRFDVDVELKRDDAQTRKDYFKLAELEKKIKETEQASETVKQRERVGADYLTRYFETPKPIKQVDFKLLSTTTGFPEEKIRPIAERADNNFAFEQAANLNAAYADAYTKALSAMNRGAAIPVADLDRERKNQLRRAIESQMGEKHPKVVFNPADYVWEVEGPKNNSPRPTPAVLGRGAATVRDFSTPDSKLVTYDSQEDAMRMGSPGQTVYIRGVGKVKLR